MEKLMTSFVNLLRFHPKKTRCARIQWMCRIVLFLIFAGIFPTGLFSAKAQTNAVAVVLTNSLSEPLSVLQALNIALQKNAQILRGRADLEAAHGVVIQTRAIVIPKLVAGADYQQTDPHAIESFSSASGFGPEASDREWSGSIRLIQSIYEGGRITSSLRAAKLTREQAILNYQTVVEDTLRDVRIAYDDILLAQASIGVQESSVQLLSKELEDTSHRFEAGTVPRFDVLRAEVEIANARPRLSRAKNAYRIAKNNLSNLLGYDLPKEVGEDIPLNLTDKLNDAPYEIQISDALRRAYENRTELAALRKAERLRAEDVTKAKSGYKPSVQIFGGYGSRSSSFDNNLGRDVTGWFAGAQLNWNIFDGFLTRGKVIEAKALLERAGVDVADFARRIELEVRTAFSSFVEAREVLESQKKVQEQAEEALRLAKARVEAGAATQLDVLSAQTALTEARSTQIQALRDYSVAKTRLNRAMGNNIEQK
ncbi:MAG: TolC family protein [Verrucomicrobiota bacterium]